MVENRPWLTCAAHGVLVLGVLIVGFPVYMTFVASTHDQATMLSGPAPLLPGRFFAENYRTVLLSGLGASSSSPPVALMMFNSLVMALAIALGKIAISIIAAYAIVYFKFPFRMTFFWMIFITLMLPVEVRMTEAARIDGAGPMRFFRDILLPLSATSIAALFVIQFIYGWNQYLWPLLVTTGEDYYTVVMGISRMVNVVDAAAKWNLIMAVTVLAMIPPVIVVIFMQRQFVKGLIETEK